MATSPIPTIPKVTLWFNPACKTCLRAKELLDMLNVQVETFLYLETPPTRAQLEEVIRLVRVVHPNAKGAHFIVRQKEPIYEQLGLHTEAAQLDGGYDERLIEAMLAHPELIQRPIGVVADRGVATVARPPELVLGLLRPPTPAGTDPNDMIRRMMQGKLPGS